jgi:predicted RNA-binding protein
MCLAKAYMGKISENELLAEDVSSIRVEGGRVRVTTLFGEQKEYEAGIREIDFRASRILLDKKGS